MRRIEPLYLLIIGGSVLILLACLIVPKLKFVSNFDNFHFVDGETTAEIHQRALQYDSFPEQEVIILYSKDDWLTTAGASSLMSTTNRLKKAFPEIQINSLTSIEIPRKKGLFIRSKTFFAGEPTFEELQQVISNFSDVHEKFISPNQKYALIYSENKKDKGIDLEVIRHIVKDSPQIDAWYVFNHSSFQTELQQGARQNILRTLGLTLSLILLAFYLLVRSFRLLAFIGFLLFVNLSMLALAVWIFDIEISPHLTSLPGLTAILTFSDALHVLYFKYQQQLYPDSKSSPKSLVLPLVLTSATNCLGFIFYLFFTDSKFMVELSLLAVLTVLLALLLSLLLLWMDFKFKVMFSARNVKKLTEGALSLSKKFRPQFLSFLLLFLTTVGIMTCFKFIFIETPNSLSSSGEMNEKGMSILQNNFFGKQQLEASLQIDTSEQFTDSQTALNLELIESAVDSLFHPFYLSSPNQVMRRFNRFTRNNSPKTFELPSSWSSSKHQLFHSLKEKAGWYEVVQHTRTSGRLMSGYSMRGIPERVAAYDQLEEQLDNIELEATLGGMNYYEDIQELKLLRMMFSGFIFTFLVAALIIGFLLKSLKSAGYFLLVNLFPLVLALNLMIMVDVPLNSLSVFMLSIMIGLGLDDSIFLMVRPAESWQGRTIFYPIIVTSIVLSFGVLGFASSSYLWLQPFSFILLICFLTSLILDIALLGKVKEQ